MDVVRTCEKYGGIFGASLLVLTACNQPPGYNEYVQRAALGSDFDVCSSAVSSDLKKWESSQYFSLLEKTKAFRDEANKRRLSLDDCRQIISQRQIAINNPSKPKPTAGFLESLRGKSDVDICLNVTISDTSAWESKSTYRPHVEEARRRNLTLVTCRELKDDSVSVATKSSAAPGRHEPAVRDDRGPRIEIPVNQQAGAGEFEIAGRVSDDSGVAQVLVDGKQVKVSGNRRFRVSIYVPMGGRDIVIEAVDKRGNRTTKGVRVTRSVATSSQPVANFVALDPTRLKARLKPDALAIVIGVESYRDAPGATFADRDAQYFMDYAHRALGVPEQNIKLLVNDQAGRTGLKKALKLWLPAVAAQGKSDIYIFFAGHGLASADGKRPYLLPHDADIALLDDTALKRKEVFETLAEASPRSVTVFLDTCYSGGTRSERTLVADARGIRITQGASRFPKNFTVLSAAGNDQISSSLPEVKHGLFSYFLMRGLEGEADHNGDRRITTGELHRYVTANVPRQAVRLGRKQNPQLAGDPNRIIARW